MDINDNVKLYIGDISKLKAKLDLESVNMIYLDPPFNSDRDYKLNDNSNIGFGDKWTDNDYENFISSVIDILHGLLKKDGTLFFHISASEMFIPEKILRDKFKFVTPIFWKKCRSKNNVKNKMGSTIDKIGRAHVRTPVTS